MLPAEEMAAIHLALTDTQGERATAAQKLGLTEEELRAKISESSELRILWGARAEAPTLQEALTRDKPDLGEPVDFGEISPKRAAMAEALVEQEEKLQRFDWEGLGVRNPNTVELMRQFESGVGRGVVRLLDAMCGGMGYCFAQVSSRFAYAAGKLEDPRTQADPALYQFWHDIFMDCAKEMKGFNREATAAAHTRLLIADKAKKMSQAVDKLRKPGWKRVTPAAAPAEESST